MEPQITLSPERRLVGLHRRMTLAADATRELWRGFMPRRKEIGNALNSNLISLQVYDSSLDFASFRLDSPFEKWAAVEVPDFSHVPAGMETLTVPEGLYAVVLHTGGPPSAPVTYRLFFGEWLPGSGYRIDDRPHFEVLGEKYRNDDPRSEEEIWFPVRQVHPSP